MRPCDGGLNGGGVDLVNLGVLGVLVGVILDPGTLGPARQIFTRHIVNGNQTRLTASLDCHVGNGKTLVHGKSRNGGTGELHGTVESAVDADHADDMKNDVLARNARIELAVDLEKDGFGNLEPCLARGKAHARIGGADARGEGTERTVGAGVRVGADDQIARGDDALLRKQRMLDAHATDLPVMGDALSAREFAGDLGLLGGGDIFVGRVVVGDEQHSFGVEHLVNADFSNLLDCNGGGNVICQNQIKIAFDQLTRYDFLQSSMGGQNLFGHSHWTRHQLLLCSCDKSCLNEEFITTCGELKQYHAKKNP